MPEDIDKELLLAVAAYLKRAEKAAEREAEGARTPLGLLLSEHLGADASTLAVTTEQIDDHRFVDADIALDEITVRDGGRVVGVGGGEQRHHCSLSELIANPHTRFAEGPVAYEPRATGPGEERRAVSFGIRLLEFDGIPLAIAQRGAAPQYGREKAALEVISADQDASSRFLSALRRLMIERSVLRGKVLSLQATQFGDQAGATFLPRPDVPAEEIVLEPGILDGVVDHVVGIGEHRRALLAAGQHLKRGVLLYGPPGTGKTLTVRHLLARTPGTTAIVLTGSSIAAITQAAELARTFQPSLVVLEDVDLVAMERSFTPQPLLFEVLDALDGLDADADVAFVMTTNRVEVLERALAERPGRVDLAVEIPLPDAATRRALFRRYARDLPLSEAALDAAADRAEQTTGSFAKELMRRTVLAAALRGGREGAGADATSVQVSDADLERSLEDLLESRAALTRRLLGSAPMPEEGEDVEGEGEGWFARSGAAEFC
ncbi:ATP-binding protein [Brachybacterium phenoliresistens]|uniref:AAA family ATPase n=1 Tax=Brachybacterium phenoliresistens TaxID=396014 RepID=UPI0031DA7503